MTKLALAFAPLALLLAGCQTYPPYQDDPYGPGGYPPYPQEPYPPYPPSQPPVSSDYRAIGTEPFWDLTIGRDMVFTDRGTGLTVAQPTPRPIGGVAGEIYRTQRLEVNIVHQRCSDGMSDRTYPDTVQVYVDGRLYRGCGGAADEWGEPTPPNGPAPTLDRTRWAVVAINGRMTPAQGEFLVEFDSRRLGAKFGCNGLGAGYTQSGNMIDAGAIIGTQMACPDMSWESQGSAILDQRMTVEWLDENRIALVSSAGRMELVRR